MDYITFLHGHISDITLQARDNTSMGADFCTQLVEKLLVESAFAVFT